MPCTLTRFPGPLEENLWGAKCHRPFFVDKIRVSSQRNELCATKSHRNNFVHERPAINEIYYVSQNHTGIILSTKCISSNAFRKPAVNKINDVSRNRRLIILSMKCLSYFVNK